MSYTPGPWLIREGFSFDTWEVYPTRDGPPEFGEWSELATVQGDYGDDEGAEGLANARLIAAAPEMHEALTWVVDHMCEGFCKDLPLAGTYSPDMDEHCAACKARAALAKAEGK